MLSPILHVKLLSDSEGFGQSPRLPVRISTEMMTNTGRSVHLGSWGEETELTPSGDSDKLWDKIREKHKQKDNSPHGQTSRTLETSWSSEGPTRHTGSRKGSRAPFVRRDWPGGPGQLARHRAALHSCSLGQEGSCEHPRCRGHGSPLT